MLGFGVLGFRVEDLKVPGFQVWGLSLLHLPEAQGPSRISLKAEGFGLWGLVLGGGFRIERAERLGSGLRINRAGGLGLKMWDYEAEGLGLRAWRL